MSREAQRWDDEEEDSEYPFVIYTQADGHTSGRNVVLNARNQEELARWTKAIDDARNEARLESIRSSDTHYLAPYMRKVAAWYNSNLVQYSVAVVIFASYGIAIVNSQLLPPPGSDSEYYMKLAEWIFTSIFALELAVNLFGHWFWPFFNCTWNCFDFLVVGCSVVSLIIPALPGKHTHARVRAHKRTHTHTHTHTFTHTRKPFLAVSTSSAGIGLSVTVSDMRSLLRCSKVSFIVI